jgi:hypothetical protein
MSILFVKDGLLSKLLMTVVDVVPRLPIDHPRRG